MADQPLFGAPTSTPEQRKYSRALAEMLLKQGMSGEPIRSPLQGVGRIVQALVGGYMGNQANKAETEQRAQMAKNMLEAMNSGDRAKMLAAALNPNNPEGTARVLAEGGFLRPLGEERAGEVSRPVIAAPMSGGGGGGVAPPPAAAAQPIQPRPVQTVTPPPMQSAAPQQPATFNQRFGFDPAASVNALDPLAAKSREFADLRARTEMGIKSRGEDFERGQGAPERINAIRTLADAYRAGGDNISGGPLGRKLLEGKQLFHQLTGIDLGGTPESEIITHANQGLAGALARSLSSRGATNNEFNQMMAANPGVMMSNPGARYMLNLMEQQEAQSHKLGILGQTVPAEGYAAFKQKFYADPENQLKSPFNPKKPLASAMGEDLDRLRAETQKSTVGAKLGGANAAGWKIERAQ